MKRYLSGIQATGGLHIGNYLGMIKPCVEAQHDGETIYFIPSLHSLNVRPKPDVLRHEILANLAWFIAAGLDTDQSIIYNQSDVTDNAELCWILNNFVTMGELGRMTQYKDKSLKRGPEGELVALFTYPVLMAADILLYSATHIPVGDDQKQHVELTRDIAERFNNIYGTTFVVPEPVIGEVGARIMSLQDPESKMSKSDSEQGGNILLLDDAATIRNKVKRAVTDSGSTVEASNNKPAIANLLQIYAAFTGKSVETIQTMYAGKGYGELKHDLAELIVEGLVPVQEKFQELMGEPAKLEKVLAENADKARVIAEPKLQEVKQKIGLL